SGALNWADLIVFTGGLGPTEDDLTRDAVARVLKLPMDENEAVVERIRARFARRGMTMPEINRRQVMVLRGATLLDNPNGTAPGPRPRSRRRSANCARRWATRCTAWTAVRSRRSSAICCAARR